MFPTPEQVHQYIADNLPCEHLQVQGDGSHFEALIDASIRDVTNGVSGMFEGAGRYASGANQGVLARALAEPARLWLLTDIIVVPWPVPFAGVFSPGDLLLTLGGAVFCHRAIRGTPPSPAAG